MTELNHLFSPLQLGHMRIANRIMMPGMSAGMMLDREGFVTPEMIAYYCERAATRPGLMAIGASAVVPPAVPAWFPLALYHDRIIPSLKTLVDAVHEHDTRFGIQLWEGGTQAGGMVHLSPSGISAHAKAVFDAKREMPVIKTLSEAEVAEVVGHFGQAAERCARAGFDFVEIHAGHGYLISAFLSSHFNQRTDAWGGSFENRSRFLLEILRTVKARVGGSLTVGVKINGDDFLPQGGWGLEDACRIAPMLEAEGADYLSVTAGVMGGARLTVPPLYEKQGCYADMAQAVKQLVSIPVATVGRVKRPAMANELVRDGVVDFVCMGRALIADSQIIDKARAGRFDEIRPCLAECRGCIDQEMRSIKSGSPGHVSCVVNPRMQRESVCIDIEGDKKDAPRKVLVAGAGLAGLEAARRTAFSGHEVILCESGGQIGGQIRYAAMIPGRGEIADILPWYEGQLSKYGVEVRLNTTVDDALLDALAPEVVFVATGSLPRIPQSMLDVIYQLDGVEVMTVDDVLEGQENAGRTVLVLGGDQIGMQIADFLSEDGRQVHVAESENHFAQKMAANDRWYLVARTIAKGVKRYKNIRSIEAGEDGVIQLRGENGTIPLPDIDSIVFASERRSVRAVEELARSRGIETYLVGDAADVVSEDSGTIFANIAQAYDLARQI